VLEKLNKYMLELPSQLALLKTIIDEVHPLSTESWEDTSVPFGGLLVPNVKKS
jgi:hypothetical protein